MKKISITDITLKKLAQDREVSLLFREKTAITACADSLGVEAVELAQVKNVREDSIIYKTIAQNTTNSTVAIPVGFLTDEVETAWDCIKDAKKPRLQVELPMSTALMEYTYHIKADKMISKIGELTAAAKKLCSDVEFVALDATRADADFLISAAREAEKCGAGIITICDDAGVSLPEEISALVKDIKSATGAKVYVQVSDRLGMAVASGVAAIGAGADGLKCSMVSGSSTTP